MTADGGLVDVRYVVLDATKAIGMLSNVANLPVVSVDGSASSSRRPRRWATSPIRAGRSYFLLYRNAGGAVKPGTPVTVIFPGGLAIEHRPRPLTCHPMLPAAGREPDPDAPRPGSLGVCRSSCARGRGRSAT